MRAESIGGDNIRASTKIVFMDLLKDFCVAVVHQGIGRPKRQSSIHAAAVEFSACGTVKDKLVRLGEGR
jgi:hypothetical protein